MRARALLPETESLISTHAMHESECAEVRMRRTRCLMRGWSSRPMMDDARLFSNATRVGLTQSREGRVGNKIGTSITLMYDVEKGVPEATAPSVG